MRLPQHALSVTGGAAAAGAGGALRQHQLTVSLGYRAAFVGVFDHATDASRGVDVPPALATLLPAACAGSSSCIGGSRWQAAPEGRGGAGAKVREQPTSPLLERLQRDCGARQAYSNGGGGSVVPLPIPDFSMPFNVICFTSTLLAVLLGGALNTVLRWVGGRPAPGLAAQAHGVGASARAHAAQHAHCRGSAHAVAQVACCCIHLLARQARAPLPSAPPPCPALLCPAGALRSWQAGALLAGACRSGSASCGACSRCWRWRRRWQSTLTVTCSASWTPRCTDGCWAGTARLSCTASSDPGRSDEQLVVSTSLCGCRTQPSVTCTPQGMKGHLQRGRIHWSRCLLCMMLHGAQCLVHMNGRQYCAVVGTCGVHSSTLGGRPPGLPHGLVVIPCLLKSVNP